MWESSAPVLHLLAIIVAPLLLVQLAIKQSAPMVKGTLVHLTSFPPIPVDLEQPTDSGNMAGVAGGGVGR